MNRKHRKIGSNWGDYLNIALSQVCEVLYISWKHVSKGIGATIPNFTLGWFLSHPTMGGLWSLYPYYCFIFCNLMAPELGLKHQTGYLT